MSHHSAFIIHPSKKSEPVYDAVRNRLYELLKLEDGWLNGEGKSLPEKGVEQFLHLFEKYFAKSLPIPYLFPTVEGNLQAEWILNDNDITLNINLSNQFAQYHTSSTENEEIDEMELNLTQQLGWGTLVQKLTALSKS